MDLPFSNLCMFLCKFSPRITSASFSSHCCTIVHCCTYTHSGEILQRLDKLGQQHEHLAATVAGVHDTVLGLLTRRMDPWESVSHATADSERREFKIELEQNYGATKCMVTGLDGGPSKVTAAHIWPASARDPERLSMFNLTRDDIMSWRNGIFILDGLEKRFDEKRVGFQYDSERDLFILRVFDKTLETVKVSGAHRSYAITYGKLDGEVLKLPEGKVPFRRLLVWHYAACLADAKHWGREPMCNGLSAVPEPQGIDRVHSWLERSPGASLPDVGMLARASRRVVSVQQPESSGGSRSSHSRDQASVLSGGCEGGGSGGGGGDGGGGGE